MCLYKKNVLSWNNRIIRTKKKFEHKAEILRKKKYIKTWSFCARMPIKVLISLACVIISTFLLKTIAINFPLLLNILVINFPLVYCCFNHLITIAINHFIFIYFVSQKQAAINHNLSSYCSSAYLHSVLEYAFTNSLNVSLNSYILIHFQSHSHYLF